MTAADRKLFLGGRLKRLRRDLGLTQTAMAEGLGVSPSYLNHLERNQRPLTAQVLLRLADAYDVDVRTFSNTTDTAGAADLQEAFGDVLFRDLAIPRHEITDLAENAPAAAEAMVRLYRAYVDAGRRHATIGDSPDGIEGAASNPTEWVRDYIQAHRNHFPDLDALGEALSDEMAAQSQNLEAAATAYLRDKFGVQVRVMPLNVMGEWTRRYDLHRRRLMLSETLRPPSRLFATLYQVALSSGDELLETLSEAAGPPDLPTRRLLKVSLTNYLAAAILMPYAPFHTAAEANGYDIDLLKARFGASFEQVAHRLTTLARPGARGVPFFLIRIDPAGNVSKRFASGPFPFSRFGGTCPRWNINACFQTPGRILTQVIETMDGEQFFTLARTVRRPIAAYTEMATTELAIGLGCELRYADKLAYAKAENAASAIPTQVGTKCRLCERPSCRERAEPPVTRTLMVDQWTKWTSPFPFSAHS